MFVGGFVGAEHQENVMPDPDPDAADVAGAELFDTAALDALDQLAEVCEQAQSLWELLRTLHLAALNREDRIETGPRWADVPIARALAGDASSLLGGAGVELDVVRGRALSAYTHAMLITALAVTPITVDRAHGRGPTRRAILAGADPDAPLPLIARRLDALDPDALYPAAPDRAEFLRTAITAARAPITQVLARYGGRTNSDVDPARAPLHETLAVGFGELEELPAQLVDVLNGLRAVLR